MPFPRAQLSDELRERIRNGASINALCRETGISRDALRRARDEMAREHAAPPTPAAPAYFPTGNAADDVGLARYYDSLIDAQETAAENDTEETHLQREWGDRPTALFCTGDWHIGSSATDHRRLRDDMQWLGDYRAKHVDAVHLAFLGDLTDNYLPNMGRVSRGMADAAMPDPSEQERVGRWALRQAGPLDVIMTGCHDAWGQPAVNRTAERAQDLGATNGGFGAVLDVTVGKQEYRVVMRHRWRRESSLNTTNAQRAMDDDFPTPAEVDGPARRADAYVLGHLHNSDLQERSKGGRRVVFARVGSYKGGDTYTRQGGFVLDKYGCDAGNVVLILNPAAHDVLTFPGRHWRLALETLARLRGEGK